MALAPADPMAPDLAPDSGGHGRCEGRGPAVAHEDDRPVGSGQSRRSRGVTGGIHRIQSRLGHRPRRQTLTLLPERHVDGPVRTSLHAELTGAVERINDPYPRGRKPGRAVRRLLRQDGVVRSGLGQPGQDQLVRTAIALCAAEMADSSNSWPASDATAAASW